MNALRELTEHLNFVVINAYGGKCLRCGENDHNYLILHHSYHDGHIVRKHFNGNVAYFTWLQWKGFPDDLGLQILCYKCHARLEGRLRGVCFDHYIAPLEEEEVS